MGSSGQHLTVSAESHAEHRVLHQHEVVLGGEGRGGEGRGGEGRGGEGRGGEGRGGEGEGRGREGGCIILIQ